MDSLHRRRGYVVLGGSKNCTGVCIVLYCIVFTGAFLYVITFVSAVFLLK